MKKVLSVLSLVVFTQACSVFSPSTVKTEDKSGSMPDFYVFSDFKKVKGRSIASSNEGDQLNKGVSAFSNRKIYFLTLLSQYNDLKHITRIDSPEVKVCPSFHTEVLDNKKFTKPTGKAFVDIAHSSYPVLKDVKGNAEALSLYPELAMPITADALHPSVIDYVKEGKETQVSDLLVKAYKIHLGKIYHELNEMCEKGQTDNFYVFENLVTYTKTHPDFKDQKYAMKSILKSSVFANMYLMHSFKIKSELERKVASANSGFNAYEEEVVTRTDTFWVKNYFDELKTRRVERKF